MEHEPTELEVEFDKVYGKVFEDRAFDPSIIVGMITAIFQIIQQCRSGASGVERSMVSGDIQTKIAIRRAVRQQHPEMSRRERRELGEALYDRMRGMNSEERERLISEANSGVDLSRGDQADLGFIPMIAFLTVSLFAGSVVAGPFTDGLVKIQDNPGSTIQVDRPGERTVKVSLASEDSDSSNPFGDAITPYYPANLGPDRVIILWSPSCRYCPQVIHDSLQGLSKMALKHGWTFGDFATRHFQFMNVEEYPEYTQLVEDSIKDNLTLPFIAKVESQKIVRTWKPGCKEPMDQWTLGWLYKGVNERPNQAPKEVVSIEKSLSMPVVRAYPLRGRFWSVGLTWNASTSYVRSHLKTSPNHARLRRQMVSRGIPVSVLDTMSGNQLNSLHSDDHEGRVRWASWKSYSDSDQVVSNEKTKVTPTKSVNVRRSNYSSCPSGNCPWSNRASDSRVRWFTFRKRR